MSNSRSEAQARAVRPRDAASLILLDRRHRELRVLMGRRATRHRFLPDVFVFPGGRVDPEDRLARPLDDLRPEVMGLLTRSSPPALARALAVAAVRETFEEAGLLLGEVDGGVIRPRLAPLGFVARAITPADSPIRFHARFFIAEATEATGAVGGSGELVDLGWYTLAHALTLPLADVTEFVLKHLAQHAADPLAVRPAPLWRYRQGVAWVDRR